MVVVSAIRQGSMKNCPACLSIVRFSHFPALKTEIFLLSEPLFLCLFMWYHYCSRNRSGCGRAETRGHFRDCPHTIQFPWQAINFTIWRSLSNRLTTMLSASSIILWLTAMPSLIVVQKTEQTKSIPKSQIVKIRSWLIKINYISEKTITFNTCKF